MSCADREQPPYIRAKITDLADNTAFVNNFKIQYWWEERNETPYLKSHECSAKDLMVDVMEPLKDNPRRVKIYTRTFPLQNLKTITFNHNGNGYDMSILTTSGEKHTATNNFPKQMKKDPNSGIADNLFFAAGTVITDNKKKDYKKSFNLLKQIDILESSSTPLPFQ